MPAARAVASAAAAAAGAGAPAAARAMVARAAAARSAPAAAGATDAMAAPDICGVELGWVARHIGRGARVATAKRRGFLAGGQQGGNCLAGLSACDRPAERDWRPGALGGTVFPGLGRVVLPGQSLGAAELNRRTGAAPPQQRREAPAAEHRPSAAAAAMAAQRERQSRARLVNERLPEWEKKKLCCHHCCCGCCRLSFVYFFSFPLPNPPSRHLLFYPLSHPIHRLNPPSRLRILHPSPSPSPSPT